MNTAVISMLKKYSCKTTDEYINALKEIIQEIALLGLWRAKFFEHAAFYGGTALRILYELDRFSEDLDFSLLEPQKKFDLTPYLEAIKIELEGFGFNVTVEQKIKTIQTAINSAFIKAGTKEHLLKISTNQTIVKNLPKNTLMNIKLEVDTNPPLGFHTERKILLQPIPFTVNTYQLPDLFAGKIHAILQRNWKGRIKGRDYYDFVWYIGQRIPVHISHLEKRLRQSGGWEQKEFEYENLLQLLKQQFESLDIAAAKKDVIVFLKDPDSIALWSKEFFISLLSRLKFI